MCIRDVTDEMLSYIDVLVDGEFKEALKDVTLVFRGSQNQRIIDVQESRNQGTVVLEGFLIQSDEKYTGPCHWQTSYTDALAAGRCTLAMLGNKKGRRLFLLPDA